MRGEYRCGGWTWSAFDLFRFHTITPKPSHPMSTDSKAEWRAFWNERYSEPEPAYGMEPNVFFAEQMRGLQAGRILLPAEGQGRNALHAASLGWQVVACDYSEAGRRHALEAAARQGVEITYDLADLGDSDSLARIIGQGPFDALGVFYMHLPPREQEPVLLALCEALKPGGRLILELFSPEQLRYDSGGPRKADMLCDPDALQALLDPILQHVDIRVELTELHEGPYHEGTASVVRAVGVR